jgi:SEC-C motif-containing protein
MEGGMTTRDCPCGSGKGFEGCCGPLLAGAREAATAEELMRSRYTAFVEADVAYIARTRHPRSSNRFDERAVREWAEESEWKGLEIKKIVAGGAEDETGVVEFVATYVQDGARELHEERAEFVRCEGRWTFVDGDYVKPETFHRGAPKVGRNDPCPCGSGKKRKKCCGA